MAFGANSSSDAVLLPFTFSPISTRRRMAVASDQLRTSALSFLKNRADLAMVASEGVVWMDRQDRC